MMIMTRVIGIISGKGGVGKTTVALNLGTILSQYFKRNVTVVDCNITTSHLGLHLGVYNHPVTLNKALSGISDIYDSYQHSSGMNVIPASMYLEDLKGVDITKLRENIEKIFDRNDIIILDSGPGLGREAMATLKASDEVMCIATPYVPSIIDTMRVHGIINEIGKEHLGIVLNMVNKEKYELTKHEIEHLTGIPIISSIPYDKNVNKSLGLKVPVTVLDPKTAASKELFNLASSIIGEEYEVKLGFFGSLKRKLGFL